MSDGQGGTDTSTLSLTVTPVNDAPVDGNETNSTNEDTPLTVTDGSAGDLLNNFTDVDGGTPSITGYTIAGVSGTQSVGTAVTIPGVGSITINANGSYSFTPATNWSGTVPAITYTVSDGQGATDTSTLSLTVTPVADAPNICIQGTSYINNTAVIVNSGTSNQVTITDGVITLGSSTTQKLWSKANIIAAGGNLSGSDTVGDVFDLNNADGSLATGVNSVNGAGNSLSHPGDYIYLAKSMSAYTITYSSAHLSTGDGFDNVTIVDKATGTKIQGINNIEDIIFGDGTLLSSTTSEAGFNTVSVNTTTVVGLNVLDSLVDIDGSESLTSVTLSGIPSNATLNAGTLQADGSWLVTQSQLNNLSMSVSGNLPSGNINIVATVSSIESGNGSTASSSATLHVKVGTNQVDSLTGTAESDLLIGNGANDTLTGNSGNDLLVGGLGLDTLTGGSGNDKFVFNTALGSANIDTVTDFVSGADKILLENSVFTGFAGLSAGQALPSSSFVSGASPVATTTSATVLYNTSTGALLYDADGSGSGVAVQFATLGTTTHPVISASDFIIL